MLPLVSGESRPPQEDRQFVAQRSQKGESRAAGHAFLSRQRRHSVFQAEELRVCGKLGHDAAEGDDDGQVCAAGTVYAVITGLVFVFRDERVKHKILRIFKIWEQRGIYNEEFIADLSGLISVSPAARKTDDPHEFQVRNISMNSEMHHSKSTVKILAHVSDFCLKEYWQ